MVLDEWVGLGGSVMEKYMLGGSLSFLVVTTLCLINLLNQLFVALFLLLTIYLSFRVVKNKRSVKVEEEISGVDEPGSS